MRHFHIRECGYVIGFVLVLAGLYFGAYFSAMSRTVRFHKETLDSPYWLTLDVAYPMDEVRQFSEFFEPAHALDRRLRKEFWSNARISEVVEDSVRRGDLPVSALDIGNRYKQ